MNRRTADRIRLLSQEMLQEHDDTRIRTLAAELRLELRKHLKQLRDRLAISEIRERRVRNGVTYDFDEMLSPAAYPSKTGSAESSKQNNAAAGEPLVTPAPASAEPQVQAKQDDILQRSNGGPEIKAN